MAPRARTVGAFIVLFVLWIILSGHFSGQFLLLGLASCGLVVWLCARMALSNRRTMRHIKMAHMPGYLAWLLREIFISNIKVARIILDAKLPVSPVLFLAPAGQTTDLGRFIFANSITLTPGTIAIEITGQGDQILVHALHNEMSWGKDSCDMDARVIALEG